MTTLTERIRASLSERIRSEGLQQGRQEGLQTGREEGREEVARNLMVNIVMTDNEIAEVTGLTLEQVESLRDTQ